MLGVLPLFDPPREDAKSTVATAAEMGVKIKMVTGDALAIAREMAKTLGMGANILDGASLGDSKTDETPTVAKLIEDADGFAQVFPEHKFHIVDVLQKHGHIVGMTGDGVNDAPALKKADCGIAVSGATDAARAAASIVLLTPGLSVIIDAVKESRRIFQRMNSYAIYRIAETLRVLFFMTLAILVFNFYPLTAVMIVMLALLNDGAILSIAYDNVKYRNKPESWNMRTVLGVSTVLGIIGVVAAFGLFYLAERVFHLDRPHVQTLMYLKLSVAGHLTIFLTRTRGPFWSIRPARILWMAVLGTQTLATLMAVYGAYIMTPIGWGWALFVWGYALTWFVVNDRLKLITYWVLDKTAPKVVAAVKAEPPYENIAPKEVAETTKPAAGDAEPDAKGDGIKADAAKPEAKSGADANGDAAKAVSANAGCDKGAPAMAEPPKPAEAKPSAARGPQPDVKADGAQPGDKGAPAPEAPKPAEAKPDQAKAAEPNSGVKAEPRREADAPSETDTHAGLTKLMHTTLGDVLLAGLAKDPHSVERIVAEAVTEAEGAPPSPSKKREKSKPSRILARSPSRKAKPGPSRHPKPSPRSKPAPTRRPK